MSSTSVTIKDGKEFVAKDRMAGEGVGKVIPLNKDTGVREGNVTRISTSADGDMMTDEDMKHTHVHSPQESALPEEWGSIRREDGTIENDMTKVGDTHSISINGARCSIKTALSLGMIARLPSGEIIIDENAGKPVVPEDKPTPISQTESLRTKDHQETLTQLNSRVPIGMTDAFMTKIAGHLVDGTPADQTVSEFAAACGATDQSIHKFANEYVNSLYSSGIDYAVRQSQGNLTTEQIESHLEKCSNSYRKSLMISLHLNNLSAAFELIKAVKTNKIM